MAEPVRNYPQLAHDILDRVGGEANVSNVARCATRLRLVLKETPAGAKESVSRLPGVITVVENGGQFQVVIGPHVGEVYDEFVAQGRLDELSGGDAPKQSVVNRVIATMSAVFAPFIYVLAAAGILQGALILITMAAPDFAKTGTYEVLSFMSWTPFTFLPIFIAMTASKHFKTNTFIAVLCAAAIMNPTWGEIAARIGKGEGVTFAGIPLTETVYTSSVLPPLFLVWLLSYLERFLSKHLRGTAKQLLTPLFCLLIMVPLTLIVIGPLSAGAASGIANGYNWLVEAAPPVAAAIIGGLWQIAVIFGVHWGVTPMVLDNFDRFGQDSFQAFQTAAVIGQVGAAFGVYLKSRNKELKGVALSATAPGLFGITEPALYGVTLRFKKPFIMGCISGAVGAIIIAVFGARYYAYAGLPGPLTIVNAHKPGTSSLLWEAVGCLVAFALAAALTYVVGFDDPTSDLGTDIEPDETTTSTIGAAGAAALATGDGGTVVSAPVSGRLVPMADVADPVFSSGAMGSGVAIEPTGSRVYAPFDGSVVALMPHAVGVRSHDGLELLIHVGLDTVKLDGRGFTAHVQNGATVNAGDLLMEFDRDVIEEAGYAATTVLVVTNTASYAAVVADGDGTVEHGDAVITAVRAATPVTSA